MKAERQFIVEFRNVNNGRGVHYEHFVSDTIFEGAIKKAQEWLDEKKFKTSGTPFENPWNTARVAAVFEKIYPLDFDPEEQSADLKAWQE